MHLKRLPFDPESEAHDADGWRLYAISDKDGTCQVEQFICDHAKGQYAAAVAELVAFFDTIMLDPAGPLKWIGSPRAKESVANERIFEFKIGQLRVHWFYGKERQVAILACGVLKKGMKTPKPLAKQLKSLKLDYEKAVAAGEIFYLD